VKKWFSSINKAGGPTKETLAAAPSFGRPDGRLVKEAEKMLILSWALGMDHASPSLQLADSPDAPEMSYDEAVSFLKSRIPLTKDEWTALEPQLRYRAFTVAALSEVDTVEQARQLCLKAVEDGTPLSEFWTEAHTLEGAGVGESPWYWETVYRTNMQTTYNAGRAAEFMKSQPEYLEFVGIEDGRQTEICRDRSGTILPATHPFWKKNWPPLHFNCRSTVRAVFQEEVDYEREKDSAWGTTKYLPTDSPAKGFGGNPVDTGSFYKMTPSMLDRAKQYGIDEKITAFAKKIGLRFDPVETSMIANASKPLAVEKVIPAASPDRKTLRGEIKQDLMKLRDSSFTNGALKEEIVINKTGIDHAVAYSGDPSKLTVLDRLPDILRNATGFKTESEIHGNPDFSEVLKGKSVIEVNGQRELFSVVLKREKATGRLVFYELTPWELK
jgi:SPP1 gp7 family putative phage head morphogenesis protein